MTLRCRHLLMLLIGAASTPVHAQSGRSTIVGTVVDGHSAPRKGLEDVVVTATSPSLQGEQVVVTDGQGNYRIPQLPPGTYTLRFERDPFAVLIRADVQLRLDRTNRVNVELLPEGPAEAPDTGPARTIDVDGALSSAW